LEGKYYIFQLPLQVLHIYDILKKDLNDVVVLRTVAVAVTAAVVVVVVK
jgi:hypothetical protein